MATKTQNLIKRGLALRGKPNTYEPLDAVLEAPMTFPDLGKLVNSVIMRRDSLKTKAANFDKTMESFENTRRAELEEQGKTREPVGDGGASIVHDLWNDNARASQLVRDIAGKRRELSEAIKEDRDRANKGNANALAALNVVRSSWEDPVVLLHRSTLGESSRRIYKGNLEGARPATLENAIKLACATSNKPMLAAALDVLDGMAPEDQGAVNVSRTEAAAMAQGEDFVRSQHNLASLDLAVLECDLANAVMDGKSTAQLNIRIGRKRIEVAVWGDDEELAASLKASLPAEKNEGEEDE